MQHSDTVPRLGLKIDVSLECLDGVDSLIFQDGSPTKHYPFKGKWVAHASASITNADEPEKRLQWDGEAQDKDSICTMIGLGIAELTSSLIS